MQHVDCRTTVTAREMSAVKPTWPTVSVVSQCCLMCVDRHWLTGVGCLLYVHRWLVLMSVDNKTWRISPSMPCACLLVWLLGTCHCSARFESVAVSSARRLEIYVDRPSFRPIFRASFGTGSFSCCAPPAVSWNSLSLQLSECVLQPDTFHRHLRSTGLQTHLAPVYLLTYVAEFNTSVQRML